MAARHRKGKHHKKAGGEVDGAYEVSGNKSVIEEAEGKRRKTGGGVKAIAHRMTGGATKMRLDRPGRKRGGRVGADMSPLSTANAHHGADAEPKSMVGPKDD